MQEGRGMIWNALRGGGKTIWNGLRLRSGHLQRKDYFYFAFVAACGPLQTLFSQVGVAEENSICSLKALFYHYDPTREKAFQPRPRLRSKESPSGAFKRQSGLR